MASSGLEFDLISFVKNGVYLQFDYEVPFSGSAE